MAHLLVRHRVADYAAWKETFDGSIEIRRAGGEKSFQVFHPKEDPNHLFLVFEWDNLDNARRYLASPVVKEAMGAAGIVEEPEIHFVEEVYRGTL